jgi:hypothetical protein
MCKFWAKNEDLCGAAEKFPVNFPVLRELWVEKF